MRASEGGKEGCAGVGSVLVERWGGQAGQAEVCMQVWGSGLVRQCRQESGGTGDSGLRGQLAAAR